MEFSKQSSRCEAKKSEKMSRRLNVEDEKGDINGIADAFIKKFHKQHIQRDESFKRLQDMISRGG